jgi:hypothetical protein
VEQASSQCEKIASLNQELTTLRATNASLVQQAGSQGEEINASLNQELTTLRATNASLVQQAGSQREEINASLNQELTTLRATNANLEEQAGSQREVNIGSNEVEVVAQHSAIPPFSIFPEFDKSKVWALMKKYPNLDDSNKRMRINDDDADTSSKKVAFNESSAPEKNSEPINDVAVEISPIEQELRALFGSVHKLSDDVTESAKDFNRIYCRVCAMAGTSLEYDQRVTIFHLLCSVRVGRILTKRNSHNNCTYSLSHIAECKGYLASIFKDRPEIKWHAKKFIEHRSFGKTYEHVDCRDIHAMGTNRSETLLLKFGKLFNIGSSKTVVSKLSLGTYFPRTYFDSKT